MKISYLFNQLVEAFLENKNKEQMKDFLLGLLTPKEAEQLSTRLQIVRLLKKGITQKKISQDLGVGVATVTRGSRELKMQRFQNL